MTQLSWEPLSVRVGTAAPQSLREGVPGFLVPKLREWVWETASADASEAEHLLIRLGLELPDEYWQTYVKQRAEYRAKQAELAARREQLAADSAATTTSASSASSSALVRSNAFAPVALYAQPPADPHVRFLAFGVPPELLLDVVDALLYVRCIEPLPANTAPLAAFFNGRNRRSKDITASMARLLEEARSVYEVRADRRGLQRRIDVTLAEAAERAGSFATAAGRQLARDYLLQAQAKLYALHPEPRAAYALAILAVEEVVNPFALPHVDFPILSRAARYLEKNAADFEFAIAAKDGSPGGVELVVMMLDTLSRGQSDRHGGGRYNAPVTQAAAETAFGLAINLVGMFTTGAVRRR